MVFGIQKNKRRFFAKITAIALTLCLFAPLFLSGCTLVNVPVTAIQFRAAAPFLTDGAIRLRIGDEILIDNTYIEVLPELATNKNYKLESSDTSVLRPNYLKAVEALAFGEATLTVISEENPGIKAFVTVVVDYAIPASIKLMGEGRLIQYESPDEHLTAVTFKVTLPEAAERPDAFSPYALVDWFVDGEPAGAAETGKPIGEDFLFEPSGQGAYAVKARAVFADGAAAVEDTATVSVYKPFSVSPFLHSSETALSIQEAGAYKPIIYSVDYEKVAGNPDPVIVWYLNDEPVANLASPDRYVFLPKTAGEYVIRLTVNGEPVAAADGSQNATVLAKGVSTPRNAAFDFDFSYPKIIFSWDGVSQDVGDVRYSVKVESADGQTVYEFETDETRADLRNYIGLGENGAMRERNIFNTRFLLSVKSLGGYIYMPSDYTAPVVTPLVPEAAKSYLEKTYYGGSRNYYASDVAEVGDIYTYTLLNRPNQYAAPGSDSTAVFSVYLGFSYDGTMGEMLQRAFSFRHITGRVVYSFTPTSGPVTTVTLTYLTDGLPSRSGAGGAVKPTYRSSVPHINLTPDPANLRQEFPIDAREIPVPVSTSEQLYIAAEDGYKPVVTGSTPDAIKAARIYAEAKEALRYIIVDDGDGVLEPGEYDDAAKAHAIYDYVMWRVEYDYAATELDSQEAVRNTAYYLDGIFLDPARAFAVCDGIAKAYSLLCNIEGIPCVRIAGKVQNAGHAWNKAQIGGEWYIVDCTWGKKAMRLPMPGLLPYEYEVAGHRYFLKTDGELRLTHVEDQPNNYPRTPAEPYGFYERFTYTTVFGEGDLYMNSSDSATEAMLLAEYLVDSAPDNIAEDEAFIYTAGDPLRPENTTEVIYVSFDIRIHPLYTDRYQAKADNPLLKALAAKGLVDNRDFFIATDYSYGEMYQQIFLSVHLVKT